MTDDKKPAYRSPLAPDNFGVTLVPVTVGDGCSILLAVIYWAEYLRGPDGTCAFCHGDPCAEYSDEGSNIAVYFARNGGWADTCPVCNGRPT